MEKRKEGDGILGRKNSPYKGEVGNEQGVWERDEESAVEGGREQREGVQEVGLRRDFRRP